MKTIPHGTQAISLINACGDKGMQFLQMGDQIFHAALIRVSKTLFARHPVQGQMTIPEYHRKVHFFYRMETLIKDRKSDYDTDYTQDLYIANMTHPELLMEEVDKDCTSTDKSCKKGYKKGSFIIRFSWDVNCEGTYENINGKSGKTIKLNFSITPCYLSVKM